MQMQPENKKLQHPWPGVGPAKVMWPRSELLQGRDKPGWQKRWMKPESSIRKVYTKTLNKTMSRRDDPQDQPVLPRSHLCDHIWNTDFSFISLAEK